MTRKAIEICLQMLKESNNGRFNSYSTCQEQNIDHILLPSGLSCVHFSDNLFQIAVNVVINEK